MRSALTPALSRCVLCCAGFCVHSGYLAYESIVKQLLDGDYYAMYSPAGVDNTQVGQGIAVAGKGRSALERTGQARMK